MKLYPIVSNLCIARIELLTSSLREEDLFWFTVLGDTVHHGREGMRARAGDGWSQGVHSQCAA